MAFETATEPGCFIVIVRQEVGSLMVSMIPAAVLVPIILYLCFCHACQKYCSLAVESCHVVLRIELCQIQKRK